MARLRAVQTLFSALRATLLSTMLYRLSGFAKVSFFYNCVALTLWFCCLARFAVLLPLVGRRFLAGGIADFFHTVAVLPLVGTVLHARKRLRSPASTPRDLALNAANSMRMVWVCYGVVYPHPRIAKHTSYLLLVASWCVANTIDAAYHAFRCKTRASPYWLFWAKHSHYAVTLPLTAMAEMALIFLSLLYVADNLWYEIFLKAALLAYIPAAYLVWTVLLRRRRARFARR